MKFDIGAIFGQIVAKYVRLPLSQKIALPFFAFGCIFLIMFVSRWANHPDYRVLYSNLSEGDAAGIIEKLKSDKVQYRISGDGSTVEISPPEMVDELRLELASSGLPKGGTIGFELFDSNVLGRTGFVEKLTSTRAKQGELERSILTIDAVKNVRVHITEPERSAFIKRDIQPTAAVILRLKSGMEISPQQVKGIANLVASSIERLTPDNVRIIDSKGNLLNEKKDPDNLSEANLTRLDYQRKLEATYSKQIESLLEKVLGPGKALARVSAEVDFSSFEKEEESFDPAGKVARSERSVEEGSGISSEGGVPGVLSNLSKDQNVLSPPDSAKNGNRRIESVKNYELSRAVSKTTSSAGKIQRLSVAVLVDGIYSPTPAATQSTPTVEESKEYNPLPLETMKKIENLVKQAVGFDGSRGDIVSIENIRFSESDDHLEELLGTEDIWMKMEKWSTVFGPVIFMMLFFIIVMRPLVRFLMSPTKSEIDLSKLLPAGIEELEAELEAEREKVSSIPEIMSPAVDIEQLELILSQNSKIVKDNPQQAALLIRYWLNEGRV
jgi:flagellar M-ring protein FliF